jgi:ATP-dependent Lon protease
VILPERNRKDIIDVPDEVKQTLEIQFVRRMSEVLDAALEPAGLDSVQRAVVEAEESAAPPSLAASLM